MGPLRNRPQPSFGVARDVFQGYFVAIRPADEDSHLVWIGRALSNLNSSSKNPNCIFIQYFHPTSRNQDVQDFYSGWDNERGLRWRIDETEPPIWQHTDALMTTWKSRIQKDTMECMIKIPATQIENYQANSDFIYLKNYIALGLFLNFFFHLHFRCGRWSSFIFCYNIGSHFVHLDL